ncbi:MAG: S1 RNA-binding domain-containing protein, partial [Candidatus Shikimatogenerans sp. JK-2022]|nr:S1 RNA-binding domain-containing protein [Candidatus Shikimatogenerans bostrichidophilus]
KIEVQILKINLKTKNIIVSHKILIEKKIKQKKEKIISKLEIGQIIQGKIKNIISYGAFVDLGGIDGLLHITDIMWKKKKNPFQDLKVGSEYKFLILGIDKKQLRIQLGLKQLEINPWDLLKKKIKIGSIIKGRINTITDYGAFVNIKYGIEGLLHISEVYWEESKLKDVKKIIKINKIVKCLIYNIDKHDKKIYLSIKRLTKDPWESLVKKYEVDSIYEGKVNKIFRNNYGLKIELEKNLFGILLNYDISWYYNIVNLYSKYKIGDKIKIKILSIDKKKKKYI